MIVISIVVAFFIILYLLGGDVRQQKKEKNITIKYYKRHPDKLQEEWDKRVQQLNINIEDASWVQYYYNYTKTNPNTEYIFYEYMWATEGAIAMFLACDQPPDTMFLSPSGWNIDYFQLSQIEGVYKRNDVCVIQKNDGEVEAFSLKDYDKIKEVYEKAKGMTA